MTNNDTQTVNKMKLLFRLLPVVGIVCILAGGGISLYKRGFDAVSYILLGAGHLLFMTLFLKAEVANIKYYLNITMYAVAVFAICTVGYIFSKNYTRQIDLTKNKMFSLSEQSANVVRRLKPDEVEIVVFTPDSNYLQPIVDIYDSAGKKIKWTFIDAKKDPLATRKYGDKISDGTILVKSGKKEKRLSLGELDASYENTLTNAIVEVTRDKNIKIYFMAGHGEVAYDAPSPSRQNPSQADDAPSLKQFKDFLSERALQTAQLNLAQTGFVPEDATLVVIAGPAADLLPTEAAALEKYMSADGKLLVLLDVPKTNLNVSLPNLQGLLKKYGVDAPDKIVLDMMGYRTVRSAAKPFVSEMSPSNPITRPLSRSPILMFLSETRPILAAKENPGGYQVTELFKSSAESWAEDLSKVMVSGGKISPPPRAQQAPQGLAVAVSPAPPPSRPGMPPPPEAKGGMRLVVYGTSDLIQDQVLLRNPTAVQLMLNTVNWMTQQEDLIAVPPREVKGTPMTLTPGQLQWIRFLAVLLIPEALFFGGISYAMLRRRR